MNTIPMNKMLIASTVAIALASTSAQASHFRGSQLIPSVDANGLLTVEAKSFWRATAVDTVDLSGSGLSFSQTNIDPTDYSDSRRAETNQTFQAQLPGAGLYTFGFSSCCWVSGVPNVTGGNFSGNSAIYWDGSSANTPIVFNLENVQQQVIRGVNYSESLGASGNGLTYDDTYLATGMNSQANGYSIDSNGVITIAGADTASYADNTNNVGADKAFSGKINAADGSFVEFAWVFDAVGQNDNLAPSITDLTINALIGDNISTVLPVNDPNGDPVTVSFLDLLGPGNVSIAGSMFNTSSLNFSWSTLGLAAGQYVASFLATDGSLTDQGTITINLSAPSGPGPQPASAPGGLLLTGGLLLGVAGGLRRRKRNV